MKYIDLTKQKPPSNVDVLFLKNNSAFVGRYLADMTVTTEDFPLDNEYDWEHLITEIDDMEYINESYWEKTVTYPDWDYSQIDESDIPDFWILLPEPPKIEEKN